jgi:tRNA(fMet)-specific endonuclease VapC
MSVFVLDTDILTLFQLGHSAVCQHCASQPAGSLAISVISVEEELSGWYTRLRRAQKRDELARVYQRLTDFVTFISRLQILSFTEPAILRYEQLQTFKLNIGKQDLRIAAIVLENGATLVTRNTRDFQRVPNLTFVDWSQ